ncbi:unnamed protein product [Leptidea sinapis]|uniref:Uncharacterized protein n=1 Tax=Leptidea sinapis TaxID=189913 RepID=A0A5E4PQD5_9NEOP|nr:unnamed protein product [Leptidea sinapis]
MLLVQVVFCTVLYMFSSECLEYHGRLSRACVQEYYNMFITRQIPLRTYKYYHEDLVPEAFDYNLLAPQELSFGWRIVGGKLVDITDVPFQLNRPGLSHLLPLHSPTLEQLWSPQT